LPFAAAEGIALSIDRSRQAKTRPVPGRADACDSDSGHGKAEILPLKR
jgi:hypothetical protein